MANSLRLLPAAWSRSVDRGTWRRAPETTTLHFLDLEVDGRSLRELVDSEHVTLFARRWGVGTAWTARAVLMGERADEAADPGRVQLLVCGIDADPYCGSLTARLEVGESEVSWSELRWENWLDVSEPVTIGSDSLTFSREDYVAALDQGVASVRHLPDDHDPPERRRSGWWHRRR